MLSNNIFVQKDYYNMINAGNAQNVMEAGLSSGLFWERWGSLSR